MVSIGSCVFFLWMLTTPDCKSEASSAKQSHILYIEDMYVKTEFSHNSAAGMYAYSLMTS